MPAAGFAAHPELLFDQRYHDGSCEEGDILDERLHLTFQLLRISHIHRRKHDGIANLVQGQPTS
jgi:hypothetical protein